MVAKNAIKPKEELKIEQPKKSRRKIISWDDMPQKVAFPEFVHIQYSNGMEVRGSDNDVYIDFHELPGIVKDDKVIINTTRIYMGKKKAEDLAKGINAILGKMDIKTK